MALLSLGCFLAFALLFTETVFVQVLIVFGLLVGWANPWHRWWGYHGYSGPDYWGMQNPEWRMCKYGRYQSPININPSNLLYDPNLTKLNITSSSVKFTIKNTGQLLVLTVKDGGGRSDRFGEEFWVDLTGGPLNSYVYRLHQIVFHFGTGKDRRGSEHTIHWERFTGEVQLLGYNKDLYENFTEAQTKPRGIMALSVLIDVGLTTHEELEAITTVINRVTYKESYTTLTMSPKSLLPDTDHYITYEGSLTFPGCYETVTWIILNKPVYIRKEKLSQWLDLQRTETKQGLEPEYLGGNYRPLREVNKRPLRTNINLSATTRSSCTNSYKKIYYKANPWRNNRTGNENSNRLEQQRKRSDGSQDFEVMTSAAGRLVHL